MEKYEGTLGAGKATTSLHVSLALIYKLGFLPPSHGASGEKNDDTHSVSTPQKRLLCSAFYVFLLKLTPIHP